MAKPTKRIRVVAKTSIQFRIGIQIFAVQNNFYAFDYMNINAFNVIMIMCKIFRCSFCLVHVGVHCHSTRLRLQTGFCLNIALSHTARLVRVARFCVLQLLEKDEHSLMKMYNWPEQNVCQFLIFLSLKIV